MTDQPLLSVLVATVPGRVPQPFSALFTRLCILATGLPVEVLAFADNRMRSLGDKMNGLLALARGRFTVFVDDDDNVTDNFMERLCWAIKRNPDVDVINYQVKVTLSPGTFGYVYPSLTHENENFKSGTITLRKPMQTSCWRAQLSKAALWPEGQYEVDTAWAKQLWAVAKTEVNLDETLYHYRRDLVPTEAV